MATRSSHENDCRVFVLFCIVGQVLLADEKSESEARRIKYTKWSTISIKVEDVHPDGVVGYPYFPATPAHRNFNGDWFAGSPETVDKEHPIFIAGALGTKGKILKAEATRDGEIQKDGITFPRWVLKPATAKSK